MNKKQAVILSLLALIAIVLGFMVSGKFWFRLDLTKNKAYTLAPVSRNLYTEIPDQLRITYYLSDKLKTVFPQANEIEDLLREYANHSHGKIQVTVRDPVKAQLVEVVERLGIQAQQLQTMRQDETGLVTVYSGIIIEYLDQVDVLPRVFSLATLEYDLTSRIRSLVRGSIRQAGVIVGDNPRGWGEQYSYLNSILTQSGYNVRLIAPGLDIPETLPLLIVLGGVESLDEAALYQIDRYIQMGGKVLFTVKAVHIDTEGGTLEASLMADRGLLAMLSSYGITVRPEIAMDRSAHQVRAPNGAIIRNAQWIKVLPENANPDHPVGAGFRGLDLFWANPLDLNPPATVEAAPLVTTTADAWAMLEEFSTNPDIGYLFEKDAAQTRGVKILGASLSGTFPSWFRNKPKPSSDISGENMPDLPDTAKPARIIVVGETDFATNFLGVTGGEYNLDFLLQAVDWLGNDDDIIGIRSRESQGRLDLIIDPEKRVAAMSFAQVVNIVFTPLLVVAAGIFIALRRRAKSRVLSAAPENGNEADEGDEVPENSDEGNEIMKEHSDDV